MRVTAQTPALVRYAPLTASCTPATAVSSSSATQSASVTEPPAQTALRQVFNDSAAVNCSRPALRTHQQSLSLSLSSRVEEHTRDSSAKPANCV